jgi:hypothetical protein
MYDNCTSLVLFMFSGIDASHISIIGVFEQEEKQVE